MSERTPAPSALMHRLSDLGVATKVLAAVGLATAVTVTVGVLGLQSLGKTAAETRTMYSKELIGTVRVEQARAALLNMRMGAVNHALAFQEDQRTTADQARSDAHDQIDEALTAYLSTHPAAGNAKLAEDAKQAADTYFTESVALDALAETDVPQWVRQRDAQLTPLAATITKTLDTLSTNRQASAAASADTAIDEYHHTRWVLLTVIIAGSALAALLGLLIARAIVRGLRKVQDVTEALAQGDLTRSAGVTSTDEVGRMAASLDVATASLREVMATVSASAEAVAASSEELSASSAQISASAEETSVQSGVVSGAADEVSRSVATVAAGAEQMGASIREIATNANEAARVAGRAVDVARSTTSTVTKLGDSSREIGDVVKVITSIAEQTNLLALNATIEAARAGEAGKGFAVVANEVKELAQETARATEDIAKRVEAIQGDTAGAVAAIDEISLIIGSINDYQTTIASAVEEQTATTQEMSRSVAEAAGGSSQIADNITGVATAADSTTQALTQTRTAVDELSRMATELRGTVARFTH